MESNIYERDNLKEFLQEAELQQYYELFRDSLKVTKLSQLKFVEPGDLTHIGLSKPEQRRYKKLYSKYFPHSYMSMFKKLWTTHKKHDNYSSGANCSIGIEFQPFVENNVKVPTKHIISIEDITINKELGMGQFGVVQQGTWTTGNQRLQVAIKCLGNERMTSNSTEFLKEAAVMHSIEHPNIVRLYGVVLHLDSLMLVTELAPLRSLLECLREVSLRPNFPVTNLCHFAEQICDGMTYLEKKRLIHRDLASRNILVFNKDKIKISDFGLSRALGVGKDYYQTNYNVNLKLPVAWCAPECILYLRFTSSSDVWAFGVCLWEMFTYGFQPWAAFSGQQILEAIDAPNHQRLERPECCPDAYYSTMLECWSHEPNDRPKFKDLGPKLQEIRPEQVVATVPYRRLEEGRRSSCLEYQPGDIIIVLGKEEFTRCSMWYGVTPGGACGMFDPCNTKLYCSPDKCMNVACISPHPTRNSVRASRPMSRADVKRHTYTGKRTIQTNMISGPQGDVKHTGHVGLDGAYFGDVPFQETAGCPPRQVVTPYKPSEDLEQVPLINPNSPSHLTGASCTPYPLLTTAMKANEIGHAYGETKTKSHKKQNLKLDPTSKNILSKVKCATLGRAHKSDDKNASKIDELHEYHEISDTDTESIATGNAKMQEVSNIPESPGIPRSYGDFSQSLLDEMESMFRSLDGGGRRVDTKAGLPKQTGIDSTLKSHTLNKTERKKHLNTGTVKPMSAHDEKTLATAVAMANELTSKSMNDLGNKTPVSPKERSKLHVKFPLGTHSGAHEAEKETSCKPERRNFSDEANSVPDIQSTLTEESKLAYSSLIEDPTPSTSLISHIVKEKGMEKQWLQSEGKTLEPKSVALQKYRAAIPRSVPLIKISSDDDINNPLPLPPRSTKPKLVDKPRHIRKYPLKFPNADTLEQNKLSVVEPYSKKTAIYQNTVNMKMKLQEREVPKNIKDNEGKAGTNPFKKDNTSSINPFSSYLDVGNLKEEEEEKEQYKEGSLVKDHVSVEDLLEFADQKPCGRQRGVESDEVRIMSKVFQHQVTPEMCLGALELTGWNVHTAIKVIHVKLAVGPEAALDDCSVQLANANGDIVKASAFLMKIKKEQQ